LVLVALTVATWITDIPASSPVSGLYSPWLYGALLIAAGLVGSAEVFRSTAARSFLPQVIDGPDLEKANSKLGGTELVGHSTLGPALGALLISAHMVLPFALNAISYGFSALNLGAIKDRPPAIASKISPWKDELREAWLFLRSMPNLLHLAAITAFWGFFIEMTMVALVLHSRENLGASSETYGLIIAGPAVGGIAGAIWGPALVRSLGTARLAQMTVAFSAVAIFLCAQAGMAVWLTLSLAALQGCFLVWNVISIAYRQRVIPIGLMGRVNSIYNLFGWLLAPIGIAMAGVISSRAEIHMPRPEALTQPFFVASAGCLAIALLYWRRLGLIFAPLPKANFCE